MRIIFISNSLSENQKNAISGKNLVLFKLFTILKVGSFVCISVLLSWEKSVCFNLLNLKMSYFSWTPVLSVYPTNDRKAWKVYNLTLCRHILFISSSFKRKEKSLLFVIWPKILHISEMLPASGAPAGLFHYRWRELEWDANFFL